jgi:hypothetical protein
MAKLDRAGFIELLERLGAEDDKEALAAARTLHERLGDSGMTWDDLLVPDPSDGDDPEEEDLDEDPDAAVDADKEAEAETLPPADLAEDAKLIDRLMARKDISRQTRDELADLKQDIKNGEFGAMDSRYIRALAKRLDE